MSGPFTGLELGLLVLVVEFAVLAFAIACLALRRDRRQARSAAAGATALVERVAVSETGRREALTSIIRDTYRFDDGEAEAVVADFIERERAFYNALIGVHLGRGGKTLADVPSELTKLVAPWLRLTPRNMVAAEAVVELEQTNQALTQELGQTRRVLDELMVEYNAAFMKGQPPRQAGVTPGESDAHELLSMDDTLPPDEAAGTGARTQVTADAAGGDLAEGAVPAAAPGGVPQSGATGPDDDNGSTGWDFDRAAGEVIALDPDLDEATVADVFTDQSPMTPGDLDALMDNLDFESTRVGAAR